MPSSVDGVFAAELPKMGCVWAKNISKELTNFQVFVLV